MTTIYDYNYHSIFCTDILDIIPTMNEGDKMKGATDCMRAAVDIWKTSYMDIFYDVNEDKIFYVVLPLRDVRKHFYNIQKYVNLGMVFVTSLYSEYKFSESIIADMAMKAKKNFLQCPVPD